MTPHIVQTEADADAVRQIEASRMHWCLGDVIDITGDVDSAAGRTIGPTRRPTWSIPT